MSEVDRRTLIADAALALIAEQGARGLTHRGVDKQAGLPAGSTSYYCRRRADLLILAVRRHAELDHAQLLQLGGKLQAKALVKAQGKASAGDNAAAYAAGELATWIHAQSRLQVTARFELFLAASREPALAEVLAGQRQRFQNAAETVLRAAGVPRPRAAAVALIALIEGLLLERVRAEAQLPSRAGLRALLAEFLGLWRHDAEMGS